MEILHYEWNIPVSGIRLSGDLSIPSGARALVIFSHGSGSGRHSVRNRQVAAHLGKHGFATFLFDLLTESEDRIYENRFNIQMLAERLISVTDWVAASPEANALPIALFGASTGAAVALDAAARRPQIFAVVSRGGRPDLSKHLSEVSTPVLLLVGGNDKEVEKLNEMAFHQLECEKKLEIIEGASHLFEEPGKLEVVADLAVEWFQTHLPG